VTRSENDFPGCVITHSVQGALEIARTIDRDEIFIFGGAEIYAQALNVADRLYLTHIDATDAAADTFFPPYEHIFTLKTARAEGVPGELRYAWLTLDRPR
jgi:dihydrofolate reductase